MKLRELKAWCAVSERQKFGRRDCLPAKPGAATAGIRAATSQKFSAGRPKEANRIFVPAPCVGGQSAAPSESRLPVRASFRPTRVPELRCRETRRKLHRAKTKPKCWNRRPAKLPNSLSQNAQAAPRIALHGREQFQTRLLAAHSAGENSKPRSHGASFQLCGTSLPLSWNAAQREAARPNGNFGAGAWPRGGALPSETQTERPDSASNRRTARRPAKRRMVHRKFSRALPASAEHANSRNPASRFLECGSFPSTRKRVPAVQLSLAQRPQQAERPTVCVRPILASFWKQTEGRPKARPPRKLNLPAESSVQRAEPEGASQTRAGSCAAERKAGSGARPRSGARFQPKRQRSGLIPREQPNRAPAREAPDGSAGIRGPFPPAPSTPIPEIQTLDSPNAFRSGALESASQSAFMSVTIPGKQISETRFDD